MTAGPEPMSAQQFSRAEGAGYWRLLFGGVWSTLEDPEGNLVDVATWQGRD